MQARLHGYKDIYSFSGMGVSVRITPNTMALRPELDFGDRVVQQASGGGSKDPSLFEHRHIA
jgi:hypothetical protein